MGGRESEYRYLAFILRHTGGNCFAVVVMVKEGMKPPGDRVIDAVALFKVDLRQGKKNACGSAKYA